MINAVSQIWITARSVPTGEFSPARNDGDWAMLMCSLIIVFSKVAVLGLAKGSTALIHR